MSTELIDKRGLAKKLGVSIRSIDVLMKDKGLPYFKIGRVVRFKVDEVNKWLEERKVINE